MMSTDLAFDPHRLHELASAAIEGTASESQLQALTQLLRENSVARDEYLMLIDLHAVLSTDLVASTPKAESGVVDRHQTENPLAGKQLKWLSIAGVVALAASLLIAVSWLWPSDKSVEFKSFASIAQGKDAIWESSIAEVGDRVGSTTLKLRSGIVRIEFDSGVEVTLEGPAKFKLITVTRTQLASGLLTATVPPGAEGFTVDTPSAQVIDLGTSFGIDIGDDGFSNVSVFDGEVEVATHDAADKRLLFEGESVRIGADYKVQDVTLDLKPFEKMWPTASGITGSTESIRFVPPWPKRIRFVQSDEQIFVRPEGPPVRLKADLKVNISEPGKCSVDGDLTPAILDANQSVRSYILHFSPQTELGRRRAKRVNGSITFSRPVLGIIVVHEELVASSRRFGRRGAGEGNQRRELNLTGDETSDRISLSEDRKTITLDLIAPGRSSDLVRVIVEDRRDFRRSNRRNRSSD